MTRPKGSRNLNLVNYPRKSLRMEVSKNVLGLIDRMVPPSTSRTAFILSLIRDKAVEDGINPDIYGLTEKRIGKNNA